MQELEFEIEEVVYTNDPLKVDVNKLQSDEQLREHLTKTLDYIKVLASAISTLAASVLNVDDNDLESILTTLQKYRDMLFKMQKKCHDQEKVKQLYNKTLFFVYYNVGLTCNLLISKKTIDILRSPKIYKGDYLAFKRCYTSLQDNLEKEILIRLNIAELARDQTIRDYYCRSQYMICDAILNLGAVRKKIRNSFLTPQEINALIEHFLALANILSYDASVKQVIAGLLERINKVSGENVLTIMASKINFEVVIRLREECGYDLAKFAPKSREEEDLDKLARMIEGCSCAQSKTTQQQPSKRRRKRPKGKKVKAEKEEETPMDGKSGKPRRPRPQRPEKNIVPPYLRGVKISGTEQSAAESKKSEDDEFSGEEVSFTDSKDFLTRLNDAVKEFEKKHQQHNRGKSTMTKQQETVQTKPDESTSSAPRFFSKFDAEEAREFLQAQWDEVRQRAKANDPGVVIWALENNSRLDF